MGKKHRATAAAAAQPAVVPTDAALNAAPTLTLVATDGAVGAVADSATETAAATTPPELSVVAVSTELVPGTPDELTDLLADLGGASELLAADTAGQGADEVLARLPGEGDGAALESLLEEVGADAEAQANQQKLYAEQEPVGELDAVAPETTPADLLLPPGTKPARKPRSKEPKPPKPMRATSVTHAPGDLLALKIGADIGAYVSPTVLARMNDRDAIAIKVKEKMTMLVTWIKYGGELNTVLDRTLRLLHAEKSLTSGDNGNLQRNLLAKPYSSGTARSQANQMFMALPELGICTKIKGGMTLDPASHLWTLIEKRLPSL